jgi:hypothetical protein
MREMSKWIIEFVSLWNQIGKILLAGTISRFLFWPRDISILQIEVDNCLVFVCLMFDRTASRKATQPAKMQKIF